MQSVQRAFAQAPTLTHILTAALGNTQSATLVQLAEDPTHPTLDEAIVLARHALKSTAYVAFERPDTNSRLTTSCVLRGLASKLITSSPGRPFSPDGPQISLFMPSSVTSDQTLLNPGAKRATV